MPLGQVGSPLNFGILERGRLFYGSRAKPASRRRSARHRRRGTRLSRSDPTELPLCESNDDSPVRGARNLALVSQCACRVPRRLRDQRARCGQIRIARGASSGRHDLLAEGVSSRCVEGFGSGHGRCRHERMHQWRPSRIDPPGTGRTKPDVVRVGGRAGVRLVSRFIRDSQHGAERVLAHEAGD
jgi:hypothetical protein